jgi:hypothetical protein
MKIKQMGSFFFAIVFVLVLFSGCAPTTHKAFRTDESQVELRNMQTRAFDTTDRKMMMQTIVSTMQDLDFVIDKADATLGTITGTKFARAVFITMTVTVRPRGETQLLVRASAQYGTVVVKDAETYQDFFNSLGKSMFLTAHQVD